MQRVRFSLLVLLGVGADAPPCRLLFNPFVEWWRKGPIAHQIHKFLWSGAPLHYKISMMACTCFFSWWPFQILIYHFCCQTCSRTVRSLLSLPTSACFGMGMTKMLFCSSDGLSAAVTIGIINYVLLGFQFPVDDFYMKSFEIWLASTVVFTGSGNVGYTLLEYRLGNKNLVRYAPCDAPRPPPRDPSD